MGGIINVTIASVATWVLFAVDRAYLAWFAGLVALLCLWSWLHMGYFARILARNRKFVEALHRGDFKQGSPEAERYWRETPICVESIDIRNVPDWIARVNMLATFAAIALLAIGCTAYMRQ